MASKKQNGFKPRPHANARVHKKIMARLRKMSAEEILQSSVDAGIHTKAGKLAKPYAG